MPVEEAPEAKRERLKYEAEARRQRMAKEADEAIKAAELRAIEEPIQSHIAPLPKQVTSTESQEEVLRGNQGKFDGWGPKVFLMKWVTLGAALILFFLAVTVFSVAKSALHEIEALLFAVIGSVFWSGALVASAVQKFSEES